MSATSNDIAGFYHLFLGRPPENNAVVQAKLGQSWEKLFCGFLCSDEFSTFRQRLSAAKSAPVLAKRASLGLRKWAVDFFRFDASSRERATDLEDALSLLALCMHQPSCVRQVDALLGLGEAEVIARNATGAFETWLGGFTTFGDLSCCYRLFLCRSLASTIGLEDHPDAPLAVMVAGFLESPEFDAVIAQPALAKQRPAAVPIADDLARWASTRLGLTFVCRPSAAQLIAKVLSKPVIARELRVRAISWQPTALAEVLRTILPQGSVENPVHLADDPRREFSMLMGVPFQDVSLPRWLEKVTLDKSGLAGTIQPQYRGDAQWLVIAPSGSLVPRDLAGIAAGLLHTGTEADLLYADDVANGAARPADRMRLKPDFDLTLLTAQDYVGAPIFIRADAFKGLGGLRNSAATAACSDLLFRAHAQRMRISRLPHVLLAHPGERVQASDGDYRQMLRAQPILEPFAIEGGADEPFRQARLFAEGRNPNVTVIIPTRRSTPPGENRPYVNGLLASLRSVDWPLDALCVIVGDDVPDAPEWASMQWPFRLRRIPTPRAEGEPFNYARKMNRLWREAETDHLVFLNDDVLPLDSRWLKALVSFSSEQDVGGVGGHLHYPDGSLQHVGLVPAATGATHVWARRATADDAYQDWARVQREWAMVTGAVFATRYEILAELGGLDERFSLEFNDTDLCLRMRVAGLRVISTPAARFTHVERASRGSTPPPTEEEALFKAKWLSWLETDPSWHPRLRLVGTEAEPTDDGSAWYR